MEEKEKKKKIDRKKRKRKSKKRKREKKKKEDVYQLILNSVSLFDIIEVVYYDCYCCSFS